jgi:ABC-type glycerol-3-phosphate transport system substrate-binding protein
MFKANSKLMAGAALSALLLAGCGGGGSGSDAAAPPLTPVEQTVASIVDFINNLIASNGENTDPIDINALTLAADDTADAAPL